MGRTALLDAVPSAAAVVMIDLNQPAQFVSSALSVAPRPSLPFEIFVQLLGLCVTLNRGASINHYLLPARRSIQVNIVAAHDL